MMMTVEEAVRMYISQHQCQSDRNVRALFHFEEEGAKLRLRDCLVEFCELFQVAAIVPSVSIFNQP